MFNFITCIVYTTGPLVELMFQFQFGWSTETSGVKCQCDILKTLTAQNLVPQKVENHVLMVKYLPLACTQVLAIASYLLQKAVWANEPWWLGKAICWFVWRLQLFSGWLPLLVFLVCSSYYCWYAFAFALAVLLCCIGGQICMTKELAQIQIVWPLTGKTKCWFVSSKNLRGPFFHNAVMEKEAMKNAVLLMVSRLWFTKAADYHCNAYSAGGTELMERKGRKKWPN